MCADLTTHALVAKNLDGEDSKLVGVVVDRGLAHPSKPMGGVDPLGARGPPRPAAY